MLTICILILFGLYFREPIGELVEKLKDVDWQEKFSALWQHILPYAKKEERATTKPLLQFYYVFAKLTHKPTSHFQSHVQVIPYLSGKEMLQALINLSAIITTLVVIRSKIQIYHLSIIDYI